MTTTTKYLKCDEIVEKASYLKFNLVAEMFRTDRDNCLNELDRAASEVYGDDI